MSSQDDFRLFVVVLAMIILCEGTAGAAGDTSESPHQPVVGISPESSKEPEDSCGQADRHEP
jgi:hypothetical protein